MTGRALALTIRAMVGMGMPAAATGTDATLVSDLTIRRARQGDLAAIVALLADDSLGRGREDPSLPLDARYAAAFASIDADPNQLLAVADREGQIVACLQLAFIPGLSRRGLWRGREIPISHDYPAQHGRDHTRQNEKRLINGLKIHSAHALGKNDPGDKSEQERQAPRSRPEESLLDTDGKADQGGRTSSEEIAEEDDRQHKTKLWHRQLRAVKTRTYHTEAPRKEQKREAPD